MYTRSSGGAASINGRIDAQRLIAAAEKQLQSRDLAGCRKLAEQALESDHLVDGADQILAVADVLLASQQRRVNNHVDWYAILQLDPASDGRDPSAVRRQYRRLALLLDPSRNPPLPGSDRAYKLVSDAWAVLSDTSKKDLYDKELDIAAAHLNSNATSSGAKNSNNAFWTGCPHCCHVFEYSRGYENQNLRCQNCRKEFRAEELSSPPPIVPGTETYYCCWGLFPLGFPGGPTFAAMATGSNSGAAWRPSSYIPVVPWDGGVNPSRPSFQGNGQLHVNEKFAPGRGNESVNRTNYSEQMAKAKSPRMRKKMAVRKPSKQAAGGRGVGRPRGSRLNVRLENEAAADGIGMASEAMRNESANKGFECSENVGIPGEGVDLNFSIDMDSTDDILEKLSKIPFLKDGELVYH